MGSVRVCMVAICLSGLALVAGAAEREIEAFNTYLHAPFMDGQGAGIDSTLLDYLNRSLAADYHFKLVDLPRKRFVMTKLVQGEKFQGIGLLLAPEFVDDARETKYLWSKPILSDYNMLVFRSGQAPNVKSLEELDGRTYVSVMGHRNPRLMQLVAGGKLKALENNTEQSSLRMVIAGIADFTLMNRLLYAQLSREPEFAGKVEAIVEPGGVPFERRILVGRAQAALLPRLDRAIERLPCDAAWRKLARQYGLALTACPAK